MKRILLSRPVLFDIQGYEKWLEDKAAKGLKLKNKFLIFHMFEKCEKENKRYFLDINDFYKNLYLRKNVKSMSCKVDDEIKEYEDLYKESGWTLVYREKKTFLSSRHIHLWEKEYTTIRPEAITDTNSLIKLYKNYMYLLVWCLFGVFMYSILKINNTWYNMVIVALGIYNLIALIKAYKKYKTLKSEKKLKN